jgi:3-oxoacyl-[acyl-carrier protein] reductase
MRVIRGKKALVTGAASGIGRAIALALAREGADLFLVDIHAENLTTVSSEARGHGVEVVTAICDLAEPSQITATVNSLLAEWGRLDILINNAGLTYYGATELMTGEQWHRIMSVNLLAPIQLFRELMPVLSAADEAHILNVCSFLGLVPWRKATAYQTTKFGLVGFTAALRAEYYREHFGVTALCPGFVRTSLLEEGTRTAPSWICTTPEIIASKAIGAIRKNRGRVLVTPVAHLCFWLMRISPTLVDWLLREGWRRRGRIGG